MATTAGSRTTVVARRPSAGLPVALAGVVVLLQVAYPLLDGPGLRWLTVATVVVFCLASLSHAAAALGPRAAATLLVAAGSLSLVSEAVGVATGWPFGAYSYSGTLGPQLLGVPVVVPLAWTMMAYPTLVAARAATRRRPWLTVPVAAVGLTAWDLFLDPQMVGQGHWLWVDPHPHLPGMDGIPATNLLGWLVTSLVVQWVLHRLLPDPEPPGAGPAAVAVLLTWTWLGSTLAAAVFFDRPAVGAWVFVGMAPLVVPALLCWYPPGSGRRRPGAGTG